MSTIYHLEQVHFLWIKLLVVSGTHFVPHGLTWFRVLPPVSIDRDECQYSGMRRGGVGVRNTISFQEDKLAFDQHRKNPTRQHSFTDWLSGMPIAIQTCKKIPVMLHCIHIKSLLFPCSFFMSLWLQPTPFSRRRYIFCELWQTQIFECAW